MQKTYLDLAELDVVEAAEAGAKIELEHPVTKKGVGQYIHIVGKDSQAFRDLVKFRTDEQRRKDFQQTRRGRTPEPRTADEDDAAAIALLVACTTGFSCDPVPEIKDGDKVVSAAREGGNFLYYRGAKLTYDEANAYKFYNDPGMAAFRTQIDRAIVDYENFMKA